MMKDMNTHHEAGEANPLLISTILFAILTVVCGGVMVWALVNYSDQKNNVDQIVAREVDAAKAEQQKEDEKVYNEKLKEPHSTYSGPSDLGAIEFQYPRTWSVYEADNGVEGELAVYFHPGVVPSIENDEEIFALQVNVIDTPYDEVMSDYEGEIEDGAIKASPYKTGEYEGMRLSGALSETHNGVITLFKIRDKTLVLTANANSFVGDLDKVVLKTLRFNP